VSSSTAKRLILYRFDRQPVEGLVHADTYLQAGGVELMLTDGSLQVIDYNVIKALCFAAEGAPADLFITQNSFERRPKTPGLWASFRLRDGDILEGVLPHNILEWPAQGYLLTPPKASAYRQRVFLPRQAIQETALLGLVGKANVLDSKIAGTKKSVLEAGKQLTMFD
jgi:hypothetical protein